MSMRYYDGRVLRVDNSRTLLVGIKLGFGVIINKLVRIEGLPEGKTDYRLANIIKDVTSDQMVTIRANPQDDAAILTSPVWLTSDRLHDHADAIDLDVDIVRALDIGKFAAKAMSGNNTNEVVRELLTKLR